MDQSKIDEAMEKLLFQPKEVEVDGQRVVNQSVDDVIKADKHLASRNALKGRTLPIRIGRFAAGGGVL